jgi:hypothetical protein
MRLEFCGRPSHWIGLDWIGLDWIGLDWIGLDWIVDWIGLDWIGLDWIGLAVAVQAPVTRSGYLQTHRTDATI